MIKAWALALFLAGLWMVLVAPGSCIGGSVMASYAITDVDRVGAALPADTPEARESLERIRHQLVLTRDERIRAGVYHLITGGLLIIAAVSLVWRPRRGLPAWTPP